MALRSLLPSVWRGGSLMRYQGYPFHSLYRDMDEMFDRLWSGFDVLPFGIQGEHPFVPSIDVVEDNGMLKAVVELPGMDEKDVEVLLTDDTLTIKGEKKEEKEEKRKDYYRTERTYGSFHRVIALPKEVDTDKVEARFKNGVLTVEMHKREETKEKGTKVQIRTE